MHVRDLKLALYALIMSIIYLKSMTFSFADARQCEALGPVLSAETLNNLGAGSAKELNEDGRVHCETAAALDKLDFKSQFRLALYAQRGEEAKIFRLLRMSADQGFPLAHAMIASFYYSEGQWFFDPVKGNESLSIGLQAGIPDSKARAAEQHFTGRRPLSSDAAAVEMLQDAIKKGSIHAKYVMAGVVFSKISNRYTESHGISLLEQAADNGHGLAAFNLATFIIEGKLVKRDPVRAYKYFEIASRMPSLEKHAFYNLGLMNEKGEGVRQHRTSAQSYYELAAGAGSGVAALRNAKIWIERREFSKAKEFLEKALSMGDEFVKAEANRLLPSVIQRNGATANNASGNISNDDIIVSLVVLGAAALFIASRSGGKRQETPAYVAPDPCKAFRGVGFYDRSMASAVGLWGCNPY
jgi:TPR repeat protein